MTKFHFSNADVELIAGVGFFSSIRHLLYLDEFWYFLLTASSTSCDSLGYPRSLLDHRRRICRFVWRLSCRRWWAEAAWSVLSCSCLMLYYSLKISIFIEDVLYVLVFSVKPPYGNLDNGLGMFRVRKETGPVTFDSRMWHYYGG